MIEHRTYLATQLEHVVVNQRNELSEKIASCNEHECSACISEQLRTINKWEYDSIELIKQSAVLARKRLEAMALQHFHTVKDAFATLSDQLNRMMEEESFFENDIEQLQQKIQKLKHDVESFPLEVKINTLPCKLIDVYSDTTSQICLVESVARRKNRSPTKIEFVDKLLTVDKPNMSINLSIMQPGRILPINSQSIGFILKDRISAFDPSTKSWASMGSVLDADELHWSDHLKVFLYLKYSKQANTLHKLFQFDPKSSSCEEFLRKYGSSRYEDHGDIRTFSCFGKRIAIVKNDSIEHWSADSKDWHTCADNVTRWYPPVAWRSGTQIQKICMNETNYAFLAAIYGHNKQKKIICMSLELEIRNRGMSILHCIALKPDISYVQIRLCCLPKAAGWLLFTKNGDHSCCYVIGNDGKRYEQSLVLSSNIDDIIVFGDRIVTRKIDAEKNTDLLDIYDWRI